jgi:hypothetical protein
MYKLLKNINGEVTTIAKTDNGLYTTFKIDPENTDYQEYLKWVAEGNTPLPAEE